MNVSFAYNSIVTLNKVGGFEGIDVEREKSFLKNNIHFNMNEECLSFTYPRPVLFWVCWEHITAITTNKTSLIVPPIIMWPYIINVKKTENIS